MTQAESDQQHLDRLTADEQVKLAEIEQIIAELKGQPGAEHLDFTRADEFLADETAVAEPSPSQPTEPLPAP